MIKFRDECCGCATESYPCMGRSCPNRNVPYLVCDCCGEEADTLYEVGDDYFCQDCTLERLDKITEEDIPDELLKQADVE